MVGWSAVAGWLVRLGRAGGGSRCVRDCHWQAAGGLLLACAAPPSQMLQAGPAALQAGRLSRPAREQGLGWAAYSAPDAPDVQDALQ